MIETTTPAAVTEHDLNLSRLARRALAAATLAGCSTPPQYLATLTRDQLHVMLDTMEPPTGSTP